MADDEHKYIYENPETGRLVFTPVYKEYSKQFFKAITDKTSIKSDFDAFKDTSIYERYMMNAVQFSSAKNTAETKLLQTAVFDDEGNKRSYSQFKKDAQEITDVFQETWLRTEYDTAVQQASNAELFTRMRADQDLYPYWVYLETISTHPREEHLELVGKVFKIGDAEGDMCFPPNGFNCGCGSDTVDDQYLDENNLDIIKGSEVINHVDPQFRFNPADQGILPKESHSYFEATKNANQLSYKNFTGDEKESKISEIMQRAKEAAQQVDEVGNKYADEFDGTVTPVNFKSRESIKRKADADFNGDASQLKDTVRNTVVVDYDKLDEVVKELRKDPIFSAENGGKIKVQEGKAYFGYKGILTNWKADNGLTVETQFNSPGMIYAKVPENEALYIMSKQEYDKIAKETGLEGGLGHHYYEVIRVLVDKMNKGTNTAEDVRECLKAIKDSKEYYSKFYGY